MTTSQSAVPMVVFLDLDSALIAVDPASLADGVGDFHALAEDGVSVVVCSSNTRAEIESLQQALDIHGPFVCESGGAALIPPGYFGLDLPNTRDVHGYQAVEFGRAYRDVVAALHRTADRLHIPIRGFDDMSVEDVARERGMTPLRARLAKLRDYTEPFRLVDPDPADRLRVAKALGGAGLRSVARGCFDHAGGTVGNGVAANLLVSLYRRKFGRVVTVALVDAMADPDLLRLVEYPITMPESGRDRAAVDTLEWACRMIHVVRSIDRRPAAPGQRCREEEKGESQPAAIGERRRGRADKGMRARLIALEQEWVKRQRSRT
jgi:mannosyl-3-phosphoglycerate phosphatase